jgi:hypothetical protein
MYFIFQHCYKNNFKLHRGDSFWFVDASHQLRLKKVQKSLNCHNSYIIRYCQQIRQDESENEEDSKREEEINK